MKGFVKKLISRLEEYKTKAYVSGIANNSYEFGACRAMDSAIDIVKQLAEEYSQHANFETSGWIPVSERLPEEGVWVLTQDIDGIIDKEKLKIQGKVCGNMPGFEDDSGWWASINHYVAWMPLPEPYKPQTPWKDSMMNKFDGREV